MKYPSRYSIPCGLLAVAIALIGPATPAAAQETPRTIRLDEAIQIALEQNPSVQQAENSARMSTLSVSQQKRALLPDLQLTTSSRTPYGTSFESGDPTVNAGLSTSIQIPNIYTTIAQIDQARTNERGSDRSLERTRQTVMFDVISSYLDVLEAQEQVTVQEENVQSVEAQEAQVQAFVDAGERPISDLYQQQASTAAARLSLVQAERGQVVAKMNLIQTLQLDPFGEYAFVEPEVTSPPPAFASLDLRDLADQALAQRPDLSAAQFDLEAAEQGVRIADSNRWPTLSLSLGYSSDFTSSDEVDFFDQLDQRRGGAFQIGLSIPILDTTRGITRERARIGVENARIGLENTAQTVETQVRTAYLDYELAERQREVAELQLRATDLALETAQQRYDVGAGTLLELTEAQVAQVRATTQLVTARYDLLRQSRLIEYYTGALDESSF